MENDPIRLLNLYAQHKIAALELMEQALDARRKSEQYRKEAEGMYKNLSMAKQREFDQTMDRIKKEYELG